MESLTAFSNPSQGTLLNDLFSPDSLIEVFESRFRSSPAKGVDRLNGFQFRERAKSELSKVSEKIHSGSFRFSPYLENLKNKGRSKPPRLVSIPTIRDRIVLHQLNKVLAGAFPECIPRSMASMYVRTISAEIELLNPETTLVCGADIRSFYDAIMRERLLKAVGKRISTQAMSLVKHAINTPTVPKNSPKRTHPTFHSERGVPQGLAISNILAAIYLAPVDKAMNALSIRYFRYVDDVLMYGSPKDVKDAHESLRNRLRSRGLSLHALDSGKSHLSALKDPFGYLGYQFEFPKVTVRTSTVERLIQSLASKFSDFKHNKEKRLERFKYLSEDRLREIFLLELNERISGAISDNRRYGWIAYFNQINDLSLLHRLDSMVENLFSRLPEFQNKPPTGLKRFARAYFEMKYNPSGGYVHDYDKMSTVVEKLQFLTERGRVAPKEQLTDEQISTRFDRYRKRVLSAMHEDEQLAY